MQPEAHGYEDIHIHTSWLPCQTPMHGRRMACLTESVWTHTPGLHHLLLIAAHEHRLLIIVIILQLHGARLGCGFSGSGAAALPPGSRLHRCRLLLGAGRLTQSLHLGGFGDGRRGVVFLVGIGVSFPAGIENANEADVSTNNTQDRVYA